MKRLFNILIDIFMAPFKWLGALIKRNRFKIYPGQVISFIGLPGTGKTLSAVAMAERSKKMYPRGLYATEDCGHVYAKPFSPADLERYKFKYSLIIQDETSLNGYDARDWQRNFKGPRKRKKEGEDEAPKQPIGSLKLKQIKLVRHMHNGYINTTQNSNDEDGKLRGVTSSVWVCEPFRLFGKLKGCVAQRAVIWWSFCDGVYTRHLDTPTLFEKATNPYCWFYVSIKRYGNLYNTHATVEAVESLPYAP